MVAAVVVAFSGALPSRAGTGPAPTTSIVAANGSSEVLIGEQFTFDVDFSNTGDATGYGPYVDVVLPQTGADGAGSAPDDGISFVSASYLGQSLDATLLTFDSSGHATHPYARTSTGDSLVVNGTPGDQLVVLRLPFGSYVPSQPTAPIVVTAQTSDLADANTPLTVQADAGFMYGTDPIDNPTTDPSLLGTTTTQQFTPTLFTLKTTYNGPEDETTSGPNWQRSYTVSVDVAAGQTVTDLDLTDRLPSSLEYDGTVTADDHGSPVSTTAVSTPSTTTPGGTLTREFASVTGTSSTNDASMTFSFHIPRTDSSSAVILDAASGASVTAQDDAAVTANWTPIDPRDPTGPVSSDATPDDHTLNIRSLAVQKSVTDLTHPSAPQSGDTLQYTLDNQVSDYFAFDDVKVADVVSDGQLFGGTPTLSFTRNGSTSSGSIPTGDYSAVSNGDGTTTVTFDVSQTLVDRGFSGQLLGGCIPDGGVATPDCSLANLGATSFSIVFQASIKDAFTDPPAGKNASVDAGDVVSDAVTTSGKVLSTSTLAETGQTASDGSSASVTLATGDVTKTIYAVNGVPCPCGSPLKIKPGDQVTYALTYSVPFSAIESFTATDYLPLPIFDSTEVSSFDAISSATPPAAGHAQYGPADTFHSLPGAPAPAMTTDASGNSVSWAYPGYNDHPADPSSTVQLLFTVTASDEPFADGLYLTNQGQVGDTTTDGVDKQANSIAQLQLSEPLLSITKGVIATSSSTASLVPATPGPVSFSAPGSSGARFTGTIDSSNLATDPIDSNLTGAQKGDLVSFAIVVANSGSNPTGAWNVKVKDDLPAGFDVPAGGIDLHVSDGAGTAIATTDLGGGLFGSGIELTDGASNGAIGAYSATSGANLAVITYDLKVDASVGANQTIDNTATLFNYSNSDGGPAFTTGLTDTATTTTDVFANTKSIVSTSESSTSGTGVAVGEIVRYRLTTRVPETGTLSNVQLQDQLPNGLTFLNDGTAKAMFVFDGSGMASSGTNAISGAGLNQTGNETNVSSLTPTYVLPDANVSSSASANLDTYASGTDVYFKLGDLTNSDGDANDEYVVVEFNALVDNSTNGGSPRNQLGSNLANTFLATVAGTQLGATSAAATVTVQLPQITLAKTTTTPSINATDTASYKLVLSNSNNANATTGYELTLDDPLPAGLTLNLGSVSTSTTGTVGTLTNNSSGNDVNFSIASLADNSSVTVTFTAASAATLTPGQVLTNTGSWTATSLPGANGTTSNATGSSTPGTPGSTTGERIGAGVNPNNLNGTGSVNVTVYTSTLSGTVYTDVNNDNVFDAGDSGISGKNVTLTGTDHLGNAVSLSTTSNSSGAYSFSGLRGGTYTITKAAAVGAWEGTATVGSQASGTAAPPAITAITIPTGASVTGTGNNLGEILRADLSIVKTAARPLYVLGQNATYTMSVANAGPSTATSTVVADILPANMTYVSATPSTGSCSQSAGTVTCNLGNVAVGATPTITLITTPTVAGSYTNTASITSSIVDQDTSNNSSTASTKVESLSPTKSLVTTSESFTSGNNLAVGEIARYRLVVTLPEVPTLSDFQLQDKLPAGLTFVNDGTARAMFVSDAGGITSTGTNGISGAGLDQTGDQSTVASLTPTFALPDANVSSSATTNNDAYVDGTDVYFKLGDVTNNDADGSTSQEFAVVEFNAIASNVSGNTAGRSLANTFQPRSANADLGPGSNTITSTLLVPAITATQSVDKLTADAGDTRSFTLVLTNGTGATHVEAYDAELKDPLPAGLSIVPGSITVTPAGGATGVTDNSSGNTIDVTATDLPLGASVTVTFHASVDTSVLPGATLTSTATGTETTLLGSGSSPNATGSTAGTAGGTTGERTGSGGVNNLTSAAAKTITLNSSSLAGTIYIDVDHSGGLNGGDTGISGKNVTLTGTDNLGNAVSLSTTTNGSGAYSFAALRPGTYAIGKAAAVGRAEGAATVGSQSSGTAAPPQITGISLPAGVSTSGTGNNIGESIVTDLALTKTVTPSLVALGDNAVFTLQLTNNGPSAATGVTISDPLPSGLTYVSSTSTQGSCSASAGTVTCAIGNVSVGQNVTSTITVTGIAGSYTNTATVSGNELDVPTSNNSSSASFKIQGFEPVKSIVSTSEAGTTGNNVAIGEIVRYRLQVTVPESSFSDLQLQDQLPTGLEFLNDGTADAAFVADGAGITSSTLTGGTLDQTGNDATIASITPTFTLPDTAVSASSTTNDDTYASGTDVYFKLGDITNSDSDANREYAVVEFNAVVVNETGNQAGTTLANTFQPRKGGSASGPASSAATSTVLVPQLALAKTVTPSSADAGDAVTVTLTATNAATAGTGTAYDTDFTDTMPAGLVVAGSATVTLAGGASGVTDNSTGNTVDIDLATIPAGGSVTITVPATIATTVAPGSVLSNHASLTSSSLPGAAGTTGNATGSDTPGASGAATGERTGSGGVNDLADADSADETLYTNSLAGHVFVDVDESGTFTAGDTPVSGKLITLTGTDNLGNAVSLTTTTDASGAYSFTGLRPGNYRLDKAAAVGRMDTTSVAGSEGGTAGTSAVTAISLPPGQSTAGTGNDFPELVRSDLQLGKTVAPAVAILGDNSVFTLTVTNNGPSGATGVGLTDPLPSGLSYVGSTTTQGSCSQVSGTVTCAIGSLASGASDTVTITTNGPVGVYANTATVDGDQLDQTPANNSATATARVESFDPTKSVAATSEPATTGSTVAIGEVVRYRLQVTLPESPTVADLQLHDALPAGMQFLDDGTAKAAFVSNAGGITSSTLSGAGLDVTGNGANVASIAPSFVLPDSAVSTSATSDDDTYGDGTAVYFKLGDVTNADGDGSSDKEYAIVEFNAVVLNESANQAGTSLANTFDVRLRGAAWSGPPSNTITQTVEAPDVTITKTAAHTQADAGDPVSFELVVANASGANVGDALDTAVDDPMPTGFTLDTGSVSVTSTGGATGVTPSATSSDLQTTIDDIPAGGGVTIDYTATLATSVVPAQVLTNTASMTSSTLTGDGTGANATGSPSGSPGSSTGERDGSGGVNDLAGSASATVTIYSSSLSGTVYLDADSSNTLNSGDSGVAGKTVTLTGTDQLGNAVSLTTTTDANGDYVFDHLRPGNYTIAKDAAVKRAEGPSNVGSQGSGTSGTGTISSVVLPVETSTNGTGNDFPELIRADLQVTKTGTPATVVAGDNVTFTMTVKNNGPSDATGVVLTDPVPSALTVTTVTTDTGSCNTASNTVTCNLGAMAVGDVAIVHVTVLSTVDGTYANVASVTQDQTDDNTGNNSSTTTTYVQQFQPVKSIVSTSEAGTTGNQVAIGEVIRYRLQVTLSESVVMTNLELEDDLPAGLQFLNDGTAKVAFVSNGGGVTSTTLSGAGLDMTGNDSTVSTVTPTVALPDNAVSKISSANDDGYGPGDPVWFKLGDVTDGDSDADSEYAIVEFNAVVANIASNQAGTQLDNGFTVHLGSDPNIATSAPVSATVVAPELSLTKTVSQPDAEPNDVLSYEAVLTADGSANRADAEDTVLSDPLPAGLTLDLASVAVSTSGTVTGATDASSGNTVEVDVDRIAPGAVVTVDYQATVNAAVLPNELVQNTAAFTSTTLPGSGTLSNPTGSVTPGLAGSSTGERDGSGGTNDLAGTASATFTAYSSSVAGHVFTDLDRNGTDDSGDADVAGRTVELTGTDYLGDSVVMTTTTDASGDYDFDHLRAGNYTVDKSPASGAADDESWAGTMGGTAGAIGTHTVSGVHLPIAHDAAALDYDFSEVIQADLQLTKTASPNPVELGQNTVFTLTVRNNGPSPATNVSLTDPLPAGFSYVSAAAAHGSCGWSSPQIACSLGSLASGATTSVQIVATATQLGQITNHATVTATELDPVTSNNSASATVIVSPDPVVADLQVTKTADQRTVQVGKPVVFTVIATNNGPSTVGGVQIVDTLPATGAVGSAAVTTAGACSFSTPTATVCSLGTLAPGASATITQKVTPTAVGMLVNHVRISGAVDTETNPNNNDASASVQVVDPKATECTITSGKAVIYGTNGNDVICVTGNGKHVVYAGGGNDIVYGSPGADTIYGQGGNDVLCGNGGNDILSGGAGNDAISGGAGNDTIEGGTGNDGLYGDAGNDVIYGGPGHDRIDGGAGNDDLHARDHLSDLLDGGPGRDFAILDLNRDFFRSVERTEVKR